ncbi:MAG: FliM/FliN family flagellar motor switch protein [Rhodomicrobium sp.]
MISESTKSEYKPIAERLKAIAKLSVENMPVLNTVFELMAANCVEEFRDYCSPAFSAFINNIASGDSWDLLENLSDSIAVIFYCPEWGTHIVIGFERRFIFLIIEAMFGGEGSEVPFTSDRPFTPLETRIGREVCEFAAGALVSAFRGVSEISLTPERTEASLEFTTLGQTSMVMVHAQILFQVLDQGGLMFVLLPQSSLVPIRHKLERERKTRGSSFDPTWATALTNGISTAELCMEAVLDGKELELGEVLRFKTGKIIELSGTANSVMLECEGKRLFRGRLGQSSGHFTVTIDASISEVPAA